MLLKKTLKCAAVLSALFAGTLFPMAAKAESEYETKQVTAYHFDNEHEKQITVVFKKDVPSIPYVDAETYLDNIMTIDFTSRENADGTFVVSGEAGTLTVDAEKDLLTFEDYHAMLSEKYIYVKPGSVFDIPYLKGLGQKSDTEVVPTILDLSKYHIDILEVNGKAYIPLATLSDLFCASYNSAQYVDGKIYFVKTLEMMDQGSTKDSYVDRTSLYNAETRDEAVAEYTYNELCFLMDKIYGKPSQCEFAVTIREKGFDRTLEETNDETRKIKELLNSTVPEDFILGLVLLQGYMYDGGHTSMHAEMLQELNSFYKDTRLGQEANPQKFYDEYKDIYDLNSVFIAQAMKKQLMKQKFIETRDKELKAGGYELVMEGDGTRLYRSGDTVLFLFDSYVQSAVYRFKKALDYSRDNGIKNFAIDLSCNGGGDSSVWLYMMAVMKNRNRDSNVSWLYTRDEVTDTVTRDYAEIDMDLDGDFDAADKLVYYDLNYSFLTSPFSFSCANMTPFAARELGIMVMGGRSGGGGCSITKCYTPDAHFFLLSSNLCFYTVTGEDEDLGVVVDVELMKTVDGEYDISDYFDIQRLGTYMNEYYGRYTSEWVDGVWYGKDHKASSDRVGRWTKDTHGCWTFTDNTGWYPKDQWQKIDGKWYFFDKESVMAKNAYQNGYYLAPSGAWDGKAQAIGWKQDSRGWRYAIKANNYLSNRWMRIDGKWYYFKANRYAAQSEFVNGYWIGKNYVQSDPVRYGWHKTDRGWWYGARGGWYARGRTYTIDGKKYTFDEDGYLKDQ